MVVVHMNEIFPNLPPVSILTVIGLCVVVASLVMYMLCRVPELLMVTAISLIYAAVPAIALMKHL